MRPGIVRPQSRRLRLARLVPLVTVVPLVLVAGACSRFTRESPTPAPAPTAVDAPLDVVARAVREEMRLRRIDVDLTDTSSVAIVSRPTPLAYGPDASLVACRTSDSGDGHAVYHVNLVRDGDRTLLSPRLAYNRENLGGPVGNVTPEETPLGRCPSTRVWEADFAFAAKARAEGRPMLFAIYMDSTAKPFTSAADGRTVFYANVSSCKPAVQVPDTARRYFATEGEALAAGLSRSSQKGC